MSRLTARRGVPCGAIWAVLFAGGVLTSCGGGTGNPADGGTNKTYLRVEATDADGDSLQYQWRVTSGSIDNRNARETVWTMPDGPGLHFAYVVVSDGKGGYVEERYATASDALRTEAPTRAAVNYTTPAVADFDGSAGRLRFRAADNVRFTPVGGGAAAERFVYLPDMVVQVVRDSTGEIVFSGLSDLGGEVSLPKLRDGESYSVRCATSPDSPLVACRTIGATQAARVFNVSPQLTAASNLRLFGHIGFADGGVCGTQNEYFGLLSAATVQLLQDDGTPLSTPLRVNRFGDYAIAAAVPVRSSLKLQLQCESYRQTLDVPAATGAAGYVSAEPIELSHRIPNGRPRVVKIVGNGPEGNVRGRMVLPEPGAESNSLPGSTQFLAKKGKDTPLSGCMYYRAFGAVKDCDAQGRMIEPISLDDWKRRHQLEPYASGNVEVVADYINKMDLNLVRRMKATKTSRDNIAFYVCNHPGPEGRSQAEVDAVMSSALGGERLVACVAMEWSTTPGVNGGLPFTKFLTFGPDGSLRPSVNLDGRGEKYLPGTCVACHGGTQYNGRFPDKGNPSPYLGSRFLPFDTGNFLFASDARLGEAAQSESIYDLNDLVRATEDVDDSVVTPTRSLFNGWYPPGSKTLNKDYVPPIWLSAEATTAGAAHFYRQVVGSACRTCHVSLGTEFDWDSKELNPTRAQIHVCGGTADIANNALMPNALVARDEVADRVRSDPALAALMTTFLGCAAPLPDPVYPKR